MEPRIDFKVIVDPPENIARNTNAPLHFEIEKIPTEEDVFSVNCPGWDYSNCVDAVANKKFSILTTSIHIALSRMIRLPDILKKKFKMMLGFDYKKLSVGGVNLARHSNFLGTPH